MKTVRIFDGSTFTTQVALHSSGDLTGYYPLRVRWARTGPHGPVNWYTESDFKAVYRANRETSKNVAWLIEPYELHPENLEWLLENWQFFDAIVSSDERLLRAIPPDRLFIAPLGGTNIHPSEWGIHTKTEHMSLIYSAKRSLPGHALRHTIAESGISYLTLLGDGSPSGKRIRMAEGLIPYRYSVIVENVAQEHRFTEKLLDCFLTGTIPIYCGASIRNLQSWGFDSRGIIPYEGLSTLDSPDLAMYKDMYNGGYLHHNFANAVQFACMEDWLAGTYPQLFEGK